MSEQPEQTTPEDLRQSLIELLDEAELDWLQVHLKREVVVWVDTSLDLVDVGMAIAQDDSNIVRRWIEEQFLIKPDADRVAKWRPDIRFRALIVQPYVLIQDLKS
jgi:hypothetical protein